MRRTTALAFMTTVLLAASPALWAQSDLLGKKAPDFRVGDTINEPAVKTLDDARGEVILIKYWGIK